MLFSNACEYGIRAMLFVASRPSDAAVPIRTVSAELGIPYAFLAKIAQTLAQAGLLVSTRGPSGGIRPGRSPDAITLRDVVVALDGEAVFTQCVLGLPGCGEQKPCPLHEQWAPTRATIERLFGRTTLSDLAGRVRSDQFRLATLLEPS